MNSRLLYQEIGDIEDDLIQEASEAHGRKKRRINIAYLTGIAACLCLICTVAFLNLNKDVTYFVEGEAPAAAKVLVPADENTTIVQLTYQELFEHYELEHFPDTLCGLHRLEQSMYYIYRDKNDLIYDTNILQYRSADGVQALSIVISKEEPCYDMHTDNMVQSTISGVPLALFKSNEAAQNVYWAEMCYKDVYLRIVSYGMDETSFTNIIRALIKSQ